MARTPQLSDEREAGHCQCVGVHIPVDAAFLRWNALSASEQHRFAVGAGEDKRRLVGMLIPEKALPELLAELQNPLETRPPEPRQDTDKDRGKPNSSAAKKGSLYDILSGIRKP